MWYRRLPACTDDGSRIQPDPLPAVFRRHDMAGFLGLRRIHQHSPSRYACSRTVLLQQVRMGMGRFHQRSKCRYRPESQIMAEAGLQICRSYPDRCDLYLRHRNIQLEIIFPDIHRSSRSLKTCAFSKAAGKILLGRRLKTPAFLQIRYFTG